MEGEREYLMAKYKEVSLYFFLLSLLAIGKSGVFLYSIKIWGSVFLYSVRGVLVRAIGYGM